MRLGCFPLCAVMAVTAPLCASDFAGSSTIVGEAKFGVALNVTYHKPPKYRGAWFVANRGEKISLNVRSNDGDPVAWVTDANFAVLGFNDDADGNTLDAFLTFTAPAAGKYYVFLSDYTGADAHFAVALSRDVRRPAFTPLLRPKRKSG